MLQINARHQYKKTKKPDEDSNPEEQNRFLPLDPFLIAGRRGISTRRRPHHLCGGSGPRTGSGVSVTWLRIRGLRH